MALDITVTHETDKCIVCVNGEVDVSSAAELRSALEAALTGDTSKITADFSDVSYIDSTGIGVLVGIAHRAQEARVVFVVAHPQKNVARVFDLLGVTEDLNVREND